MSVTTTSRSNFPTKLQEAIDRKQVGITELARRVSGETGGKELDAARRAIYKHLKGEAKPRREMRRRYETALGLDLGELEPDDEEADPVAAFMTALMARVDSRVDLRVTSKSNDQTAHLSRERGLVATTGGYSDDGGSHD